VCNVCITTYQSDTKSNPNPNPSLTTKQHAIYQSLFTNTLVEHADPKTHKLKNKHRVKKKTYNNSTGAQCVTK